MDSYFNVLRIDLLRIIYPILQNFKAFISENILYYCIRNIFTISNDVSKLQLFVLTDQLNFYSKLFNINVSHNYTLLRIYFEKNFRDYNSILSFQEIMV